MTRRASPVGANVSRPKQGRKKSHWSARSDSKYRKVKSLTLPWSKIALIATWIDAKDHRSQQGFIIASGVHQYMRYGNRHEKKLFLRRECSLIWKTDGERPEANIIPDLEWSSLSAVVAFLHHQLIKGGPTIKDPQIRP